MRKAGYAAAIAVETTDNGQKSRMVLELSRHVRSLTLHQQNTIQNGAPEVKLGCRRVFPGFMLDDVGAKPSRPPRSFATHTPSAEWHGGAQLVR